MTHEYKSIGWDRYEKMEDEMDYKGKASFDRREFDLSRAREEGYAAGLRDGGYAKKTLLDKIARSALTGMLAREHLNPYDAALDAYEYADEMLKERDRCLRAGRCK